MRFGEYLQAALDRAGLSQKDFAELVGQKQQVVNRIILGKRAPPKKHLERWEGELKGAVVTEVFMELALLEHTPPEIRRLVQELRERVGR